MDHFIQHQNVEHFVRLLEREEDGARRRILQNLLIQEEDRFGRQRERLALAEVWIIQGREKIRRQQELITRLTDGGHEAAEAKRLLANFMDVQELFEDWRRQVLSRLD